MVGWESVGVGGGGGNGERERGGGGREVWMKYITVCRLYFCSRLVTIHSRFKIKSS